MSSAIDFLLSAEHNECEVRAGGLLWRVVRVDNPEIAKRRGTLLLLIAPKSEADRAEEADIQAIEDEAERADQAARLRVARAERALRDERLAEQLRTSRLRILCEAVTAVSSDDGATWDPIRLVDDQEDPAATPARVRHARLTEETRETLFRAAWNLCTDGGAAVERLERFRSRGT